MSDDLGPLCGLLVRAAPHLDERVDDGIELLLGRIPRLQQVVVEVDDVDRLDGGVRVGVRREQGTARVREQVHRLFEELEAAHVGHAMVGEHHRHRVAAQLQLPQGLQGLRAGLRPHDAVRLAVLTPEVPGDGARHARVVVDGQQDRLPVRLDGHEPLTVSPLARPSDERVEQLSRSRRGTG